MSKDGSLDLLDAIGPQPQGAEVPANHFTNDDTFDGLFPEPNKTDQEKHDDAIMAAIQTMLGTVDQDALEFQIAKRIPLANTGRSWGVSPDTIDRRYAKKVLRYLMEGY